MATPSEFNTRRGTALAVFTQTGTYSTVVDMGGMHLVGCYSDNWPGGAGSLTFRSSWNPSGSGHPVMTEAGVLTRVNGFGSGTFYSFTPGTIPVAAQYLICQVGTAGTAANAAGGTIVLIGEA